MFKIITQASTVLHTDLNCEWAKPQYISNFHLIHGSVYKMSDVFCAEADIVMLSTR